MAAGSEEPTRRPEQGTAPTVVPERSDAELETVTSGAGRSGMHEVVSVPTGTMIDRFVVLGELGRGAMGLVLTALDPDLERRVAIKLLRSGNGPHADAAKSRLVQEARAMAQLSHPNVVTVHQVGTWQEQIYVVMELVRGKTLRQWLQGKPSVDAIIAAFVSAGRGLAAAHAAGIVHRDFKPENVLVGEDGRTRVGDFGLAGRSADRSSSGESSAPSLRSFSDFALTLTESGAVMGTPAYMSPEQFRGGEVDAKSDQFSFAIAFYEALYGERPFVGSSLAELSSNVVSGEQRPMPVGITVPARTKRAIHRALQSDPRKRYPDMSALLADLAARPWWRKPIALAAFGSIAIGGTVAGTAIRRDPCAEADSAADTLWDDARRESVQARFDASGRPHAAISFARIDADLGQWAETWRASRKHACVATRVEGTQSDELFDRRIHCLQRRRGEVDALVGALQEADAATLDRAVAAVQGLTPVAGCDDVDALLAAVPPPEDPVTREAVAMIREDLDDARAQLGLGRYADGNAIAGPIVERARAIAYAPLLAEIGTVAGRLAYGGGDEPGAEAILREAVDAAARGNDVEHEAELWISLVYVVGYMQGRADEGLGLERAAHGALLRAGDPPRLRARFDSNVGLMLWKAGRYDDGIARGREGLRRFTELYGPDHLDVAVACNNLGNILRDAGKWQEALACYREGLRIREAVLGPDHTDVATSLNSLGTVQEELEPDLVLATYQRALAIRRATLGDAHARTADVYTNLGNVYRHQHELAKARENLEIAVDIYRRASGPEHVSVAEASVNLANVLDDQGELSEALAMYENALAIGEKAWPPGHPNLAVIYDNLGGTHTRLGDYQRALHFLERALEVREAALASDHPDVCKSLYNLGSIQRVLERWDDAAATFERAREAYARRFGQDHPEVASVHVQIGQLLESRGKPADAQLEYERALAMYEKKPPPDETEVAQVQQNLGDALLAQGKRDDARMAFDRALQIRERIAGPRDPSLCFALQGRAKLELSRGRVALAIADLERCVRLREDVEGNALELAYTRFELAKALLGKDRARARELAQTARATFLAGGAVGADNVTDIDTWLRTTGG